MNREELLTALQSSAAQKPREVFVKGWGTIYIRALTVAEVEDQTDDTTEKKDAEGKVVRDRNRLARAASRLLCDESGKRLLDPDNADDVKLLAAQPWKLLQQVLTASDDLKEAPEGN